MSTIKLKHIDLKISYDLKISHDYDIYVNDEKHILDIKFIYALGEYFKIYHNSKDTVITCYDNMLSVYLNNGKLQCLSYDITSFYLINDILYTELSIDEYKKLDQQRYVLIIIVLKFLFMLIILLIG